MAAAPYGGDAPQQKRIRVCVRVRPFTKNESVKAGGKAAWTWHGNTIYQQIFPALAPASSRKPRATSSAGSDKSVVSNGVESSNAHLPSSYSVDHLYGPTAHTQELYDDAVHDAIVAAVDGYHSSVFVYGQTGTGKTHTMMGTRSEPGLIQLAVEDIFDHIARHDEFEFLLRFSYLEIYNERVYDLLAGGAKSEIKIYEMARRDPDSATDAYVCNDVLIKGLTEEIVVSVDHVLSLMEAGNFHRHTASTEANDQSSRSHTIFRLVIESQTKQANDASSMLMRSATLNLIDLAGSESVRLANTSGHHVEEGKHINRSLLTLGHIIWKLSRGRRSGESSSGGAAPQHLPYRNSKLTRILQPALGGKAQITIVCTVAPSVECLAETHSTLKFATRARRVKSRLSVNENTGESALLRKYRARITQLEHEWEQLEHFKASVSSERVAAIEDRQVELQFAIENINRVILNSSHRQGGSTNAGGSDRDGGEDEELDDVEEGEEEDEEEEEEDVEEVGEEEVADDQVGVADEAIAEELETKQRVAATVKPSSIAGSEDAVEPESESSLSRRNASVLSTSDPEADTTGAQRRATLTTVLKAKYVAELSRVEESEDDNQQKELLREFVRAMEIAEAENETRLSQIRELELENRHLRELLHERDNELAAMRGATSKN